MPDTTLLLNCGSSSIKYALMDAADLSTLASGVVQRIGDADSWLDHASGGDEHRVERAFRDHDDAIRAVVAAFESHGPSLADVRAVGHRTVHGGEQFSRPVVVDDDVVERLRSLSHLAPLHNPPSVAGIVAARALLPDVPHVAVFDTAFFAALPPEARTYAIDARVASELRIRKYGFHGTSHRYVSRAAAEFLGRDLAGLRQIVCHLGNGASISAIRDGAPIDTSMGLTPLEGLVMGTRSGDVDPGLHAYLGRSGRTLAEIDDLLNKRSGMLGLCGSTDLRDVWAKVDSGDEAARLAIDVYVHRLLRYIGGYWALLGGLDALTFTAGVGENDWRIRELVVDRLAGLGCELDPEANRVRSPHPRRVSTPGSPVAVLVVPTNEELEIALQVAAALSS